MIVDDVNDVAGHGRRGVAGPGIDRQPLQTGDLQQARQVASGDERHQQDDRRRRQVGRRDPFPAASTSTDFRRSVAVRCGVSVVVTAYEYNCQRSRNLSAGSMSTQTNQTPNAKANAPKPFTNRRDCRSMTASVNVGPIVIGRRAGARRSPSTSVVALAPRSTDVEPSSRPAAAATARARSPAAATPWFAGEPSTAARCSDSRPPKGPTGINGAAHAPRYHSRRSRSRNSSLS